MIQRLQRKYNCHIHRLYPPTALSEYQLLAHDKTLHQVVYNLQEQAPRAGLPKQHRFHAIVPKGLPWSSFLLRLIAVVVAPQS